MNHAVGAVTVLAVTLATLAIGTWGLKFSRTTSDFFVASRSVRPGLNAQRRGNDRRRWAHESSSSPARST